MKRFFALSLIGFTALTQQASAIVGGPFDNGFHNAAMESGGVYQAVMTFKNGNGYCYFSPEQQVVAELNLSAPETADSRGKIRNRAVLYYKGITYIGSAFGFADGEARFVMCDINGSSEYENTTTQQTQNASFFTFSQSSASVSDTIVQSNRNFTVNGTWEAKMNRTAPSIRFTGKGELAFLSPNGNDAIANVALNAYSNFINGIVSFYSGITDLTLGAGVTIEQFFLGGQTAIANALAGMQSFANLGGVDPTYDNADVVKIKVRGSFRYF